jgi:hypothetical protein
MSDREPFDVDALDSDNYDPKHQRNNLGSDSDSDTLKGGKDDDADVLLSAPPQREVFEGFLSAALLILYHFLSH